jgi:nucleoside-diphosphate-sugar epimerase
VRLFKLPQLFLRLGIFFVPYKLDRLFGSLVFDNSKTRKELDYYPPVSTEEGIKRMISYYLENKKLKKPNIND